MHVLVEQLLLPSRCLQEDRDVFELDQALLLSASDDAGQVTDAIGQRFSWQGDASGSNGLVLDAADSDCEEASYSLATLQR